MKPNLLGTNLHTCLEKKIKKCQRRRKTLQKAYKCIVVEHFCFRK